MCNFMHEIFILYMNISGRIIFLQMGRYGRLGEQRFHRQFENRFDFLTFNKTMVLPYVGKGSGLLSMRVSSVNPVSRRWDWVTLGRVARKTLRGLERTVFMDTLQQCRCF
ncbi:hypothetical protein EZS27_033552 [termite gut metagenome]|uniref:Uncharacterized protein n=1 Tax=termite gut metagenome TaxID=433724 RepID=A0A5J4Q515_9ZZZZ